MKKIIDVVLFFDFLSILFILSVLHVIFIKIFVVHGYGYRDNGVKIMF